MPSVCPTYYWLSHRDAERLGIPLREPSFLTNPRTPPTGTPATLRFCRAGGTSAGGGAAGCAALRAASASPAEIVSPAITTASQLRRTLRAAAQHKRLHIAKLSELVLDGRRLAGPAARMRHVRPLGGGLDRVSYLSSGFWCSACVLTRRGGVINEINHSSVHELENYCRAEARGNLGYPGSRQTCCGTGEGCPLREGGLTGCAGGCPVCPASQPLPKAKVLRNESALSWEMAAWLPVFAGQRLAREVTHWHPTAAGYGDRDRRTHAYAPRNRSAARGPPAAGGRAAADDGRFRCQHPLCSLTDRKNFP